MRNITQKLQNPSWKHIFRKTMEGNGEQQKQQQHGMKAGSVVETKPPEIGVNLG